MYEDFEEEDEDEEEFDCINSNPNAYALYMSCMNGDEGACEALEMLCGGEEEEDDDEDDDEDEDEDEEEDEFDCINSNPNAYALYVRLYY